MRRRSISTNAGESVHFIIVEDGICAYHHRLPVSSCCTSSIRDHRVILT